MDVNELRRHMLDSGKASADDLDRMMTVRWEQLRTDEAMPESYQVASTELLPLDDSTWRSFWGAGPSWADVVVFGDTGEVPVVVLHRSAEDRPDAPRWGIVTRSSETLRVVPN